jgi:hypothetical protein
MIVLKEGIGVEGDGCVTMERDDLESVCAET